MSAEHEVFSLVVSEVGDDALTMTEVRAFKGNQSFLKMAVAHKIYCFVFKRSKIDFQFGSFKEKANNG